ncbi:membrane-spanning 4-domains subfamily A member 4D-like [Pelobates fuscus]|uniref:membrane-spanning 4-domains subfamily A member 4D-like n=1 Tax=Pelobates fuscus TaxID=191477 RepID=UPI002FE4915E
MASAEIKASDVAIISQLTHQMNPGDVTGGVQQKKAALPLTKFFQGQPEALGVIQIFAGSLQIGLGVGLSIYRVHHNILDDSKLALWTGLLYIISGSLSVAASNKPTKIMVNTSFIINTISTLMAAVSLLIYISYLISEGNRSTIYSTYYIQCAYYDPIHKCKGNFNLKHALICIGAILVISTLLQFCTSLSMSIFGCKTLCRTSDSGMHVVIYHTTSLNAGNPANVSASVLPPDAQ